MAEVLLGQFAHLAEFASVRGDAGAHQPLELRQAVGAVHHTQFVGVASEVAHQRECLIAALCRVGVNSGEIDPIALLELYDEVARQRRGVINGIKHENIGTLATIQGVLTEPAD
jgi:hypothetical protein